MRHLKDWLGSGLLVTEAFAEIGPNVPEEDANQLKQCLPTRDATFDIEYSGRNNDRYLALAPKAGWPDPGRELLERIKMRAIPGHTTLVNKRIDDTLMGRWVLQCCYGEYFEMSLTKCACQLGVVAWLDTVANPDPSYLIIRWLHQGA